MKITDIVKVNISAEAPVSGRGFLNREAVACIILHQHATLTTDNKWLSYDEAITPGAGVDVTTFNSGIKKELNAWANTFATHNGSIDQARFKRIQITDLQSADIATIMKHAIYGDGDTGQVALATNIIQVQLIWSHGAGLDGKVDEATLRAVATVLLNDELINRKLLYVTMPTAPTNLLGVDNIAWHQTSIAFGSDQVYESALTMGYYSAINFDSTKAIDDVEYTTWNGAKTLSVDKVDTLNGGYSAISGVVLSNNAERQMLVGGVVGTGVRILTEYFMIVISQLVTDALAALVLNKIRFSEHTYGLVYSTVANVLDRFTKNQLFEANYISEISRVVNRDGINYWTINEGESLPWGYKLVTLPATKQDRAERIYTGTILYFALGNQIRTIEMNGLALGGV